MLCLFNCHITNTLRKQYEIVSCIVVKTNKWFTGVFSYFATYNHLWKKINRPAHSHLIAWPLSWQIMENLLNGTKTSPFPSGPVDGAEDGSWDFWLVDGMEMGNQVTSRDTNLVMNIHEENHNAQNGINERWTDATILSLCCTRNERVKLWHKRKCNWS